jgi:DNA-binding NarL/FixJ family response regulator
MERAKVLLADDHTIVAQGLQSLLEDTFEFVGTVSDGRQLVEAAKRLCPHVIVSDIAMPLLNGLDALRQLRKDGVSSKVVFLTMHADVDLATEAFRAGASAYVLKQSAGEELVSAIQQVLLGEYYVTPLIAKDLRSILTARSSSLTRLTRRQREVLQLVTDGRTMKEVGAILHISTRTAESHKYEIMQTLGVRTTAELIRYAMRINLVYGGTQP